MRKLLPYAIGILLIALGSVAFFRSQQSNRNEVRLAVRDIEATAEQAMDLTLKGINLSQGKEGEESWKLKASSAQYAQEAGIIMLHHPEITYYLPPARDKIIVTAVRGELQQKNNNARLWEDVVITRRNGKIFSEKLFYTGETHSLSIPQKARFDGPDMFGTAYDVVWDLKSNFLTANKNVDITVSIPDEVKQENFGAPSHVESE